MLVRGLKEMLQIKGGVRAGASPAGRLRIAALPNLISLARLMAAPLGVWLLIVEAYQAAFLLFLAAGLSDALDGYLAKRFDLRTEFGAYLDAIADKVLLVSLFVTLGWHDHLPQWIVILVIFRDLLIVGGCVIISLAGGDLKIRPTLSGKATTAAQILLAVAVLAGLGLSIDDTAVIEGLVWLVAAATAWSGTTYIAIGLRLVNGTPVRPDGRGL